MGPCELFCCPRGTLPMRSHMGHARNCTHLSHDHLLFVVFRAALRPTKSRHGAMARQNGPCGGPADRPRIRRQPAPPPPSLIPLRRGALAHRVETKPKGARRGDGEAGRFSGCLCPTGGDGAYAMTLAPSENTRCECHGTHGCAGVRAQAHGQTRATRRLHASTLCWGANSCPQVPGRETRMARPSIERQHLKVSQTSLRSVKGKTHQVSRAVAKARSLVWAVEVPASGT